MFEQLYTDHRTICRHKDAPYSKEREDFLAQRAQEGYARSTLFSLSSELLIVVRELGSAGELMMTSDQIKMVAARWARRQRRIGRARFGKSSYKLFWVVATQWLRFLGRLYKPPQISASSSGMIDEFAAWMKSARGLSPTTIWRRYRYIRQFLRWYEAKGHPMSDIQIADIDAYLTEHGASHWTRVSVVNNARALKAFFRFGGMRGWCLTSIADAIRGPRIFSQENLPSGPTWEDVQRLIASLDTDKPIDIRNRAAIMLLSIYGLRVGEVSQLKLEDIDWEHDQILIRRPKLRRAQTYPLVPVVGNAILQYLQAVRPHCSRREVFLASTAPFRPISQGTLYHTISEQAMGLGIHLPHRGPHALRHACATHLVSQGFSLKEIGDLLGHRTSSATRIYAKVDLTGLREVAAFDIGGLP
ncbi:MAG: site-specific integrase [Elusimicrobia bacterium]|nr:site-specific integrase [Elusimicrobiota bacterium]